MISLSGKNTKILQLLSELKIVLTKALAVIKVRTLSYIKRIKKVKVPCSLIAVGLVGAKGPLYLKHNWMKVEPIPLLSLPYPSLIQKVYLSTAGLRDFSSCRMAKPGCSPITFQRLSAP